MSCSRVVSTVLHTVHSPCDVLLVSYGFRLVATAVDSILDTVLGTATTVITVLTNSPPAGGALAVTPANGTELETVFNIAASGWTDDAGDLPLSYSFSRLPGRFPVSVPQLWFPSAVTDAAGDVLDFQALSGALSVGSLATMLPAGDLVDGVPPRFRCWCQMRSARCHLSRQWSMYRRRCLHFRQHLSMWWSRTLWHLCKVLWT